MILYLQIQQLRDFISSMSLHFYFPKINRKFIKKNVLVKKFQKKILNQYQHYIAGILWCITIFKTIISLYVHRLYMFYNYLPLWINYFLYYKLQLNTGIAIINHYNMRITRSSLLQIYYNKSRLFQIQSVKTVSYLLYNLHNRFIMYKKLG